MCSLPDPKPCCPCQDLATGAEVMKPLPKTDGDVLWAADNVTVFYILKDHLDRPFKVGAQFMHVPMHVCGGGGR